MGEKHLPASDVSHLIPCQVSGATLNRPMIIYLKKAQLETKFLAYAEEGLFLGIPMWTGFVAPQKAKAIEPTPEVPICVPRRITPAGRPVICLNTGRFFDDVQAYALKVNLSQQLVSAHLRGHIRSAKGRRARYATIEEIEAYDAGTWVFEGELLPQILNGKRNY